VLQAREQRKREERVPGLLSAIPYLHHTDLHTHPSEEAELRKTFQSDASGSTSNDNSVCGAGSRLVLTRPQKYSKGNAEVSRALDQQRQTAGVPRAQNYVLRRGQSEVQGRWGADANYTQIKTQRTVSGRGGYYDPRTREKDNVEIDRGISRMQITERHEALLRAAEERRRIAILEPVVKWVEKCRKEGCRGFVPSEQPVDYDANVGWGEARSIGNEGQPESRETVI
jgi:hypothetical protein